MITEFGPLGTWETGRKSDWGALVEETSHQKAERYLRAYNSAMNESPNYCLGVFPFFGIVNKKQQRLGLECF